MLAHRWIAAAAAAAALAAAPALAQKSKDTMRIALQDPIKTVYGEEDPKPESTFTEYAVFDNLLCYNSRKKKIEPLLAASWTVENDKDITFHLRDDVKFHDGKTLNADDVVYTINYLRDPATKIRFKNFNWVADVQKLDEHTVRVVAKAVNPMALLLFARSASILNSKVHGAMADKTTYGRVNPIGTGPYKAVSVDPDSGVTLVKNDRYPQANDCKWAPQIGRVRALPIPDAQTQIAELVTDGLDVIHVWSKDQAEGVASRSDKLTMTVVNGLATFYMTMDSVNRSGRKELSDRRVREAIIRSIDRRAVLMALTPGGEKAIQVVDALCSPRQLGCEATVAPPALDRAKAKALLAEAGYPDGFEVEITALPGHDDYAEILSGQLAKIGIHASIDRTVFASYVKKRREGRLQMLAGSYSSRGTPDVAMMVRLFFGSDERNYWRDPAIARLAAEGEQIMDIAKRESLYRKLFDRINEESYILPVGIRPNMFVHAKDIKIQPDQINTYGFEINETRWN